MLRACLCALHVLGMASVAAADARDVPPELAVQLGEMLGLPTLSTAKIGVYVQRLDDGQELFAREADASLVPASNMKIVTSATALSLLGPDFRWVTEVYGDPNSDGTISGDLVVRGTGDPSIVPEKLFYLANRIAMSGVRDIRGNIVIDDTYFGSQRMANGWEQDRSSMAYMAPTGAVSLGFNALQVHVLAGPVNGAAARVLIDPPSPYATIEGEITTVSRGRSYVNVDVFPLGDRSVVRVSGRVSMSDSGRGYYRRVDNPPLFFGDVLKSYLEQLGVRVRGKVKLGTVPEGADKLTTLVSPRLSEVVTQLNKTSNNFMAEQLALTVGAARYGAPASWDKSEAAINAFLEDDVGLRRGSFKVKNASGLHDVNRMAPRQLVQILAYMFRRPKVFPEFMSSLAVAGGSGTLSERMGKTDAAYMLRAKTGTLSIASALSGYVKVKTGETIAFSILVNDYQSPISSVLEMQDHIGAALAGLRFQSTAPQNVAKKAEPAVELAVP